MPALHVRDVPESVLAALRERAARHGQSMQKEIRQVLAAAAAQPPSGEPVEPVQLRTVRTASPTTWRREEMYGDEGR